MITELKAERLQEEKTGSIEKRKKKTGLKKI
jgi:hypothetical protein